MTNTGATTPNSYTLSNITLATPASETSIAGYSNSATTTVPSNVQLVSGSNTYNITLVAGKNNLVGLRDAINASGAAVTASILTTGTGANPNYLNVTANSNGATTLQLNDVTDPTTPVALLNHAQPIAENSAKTYADPAATPVSSNNSLQLVLGSNTYNVTLANGENNLNGLASEIDNIAGAPVQASVVTTGATSQLVLTANKIGSATMQLNDIDASGISTNLLSTVNNNANQGSNATFQLNGVNVVKTTNSINDVIPGLTFNLLKPAAGNVTLSLNSDRSQLGSALSNLVTNYNAVVNQVDQQVGANAGLLSGDFAVHAVMDDLRQVTSYPDSGANHMSLAAMGITLDNTGQMSFDPTSLNALSDSQLSDAFNYLGSSTTGFGKLASTFTQLSDPISGLILTEENGFDTANQHITNQISTLTDQMTAMQASLNTRLQMADAAVAELQSQQSVLNASVQSVDLALYGKNFGTSSGG